jgi:predicted ribosomally synthesized peptide with nif11-like leader
MYYARDKCEKVIKEELIPFAKELGYEFSLEDMKELEKPAGSSISEEDLEKVAGGRGKSSADAGIIQNITINGGTVVADQKGQNNARR